MAPSSDLAARGPDTAGGVYASSVETLRNDPTQLAGVIVAVVIAAGGAFWVGMHCFRRWRAAKKSTQPPVLPEIAIAHHDVLQAPQRGVSRAQITASIVLPDKTLFTKDAPRVQVPDYPAVAANGLLAPPGMHIPRRVPLPLSPDTPMRGPRRISAVSFVSVPPPSSSATPGGSRRNSTYSTASSLSLFDDSHRRKVRQHFVRALPDELAITPGERLAVVQTFDDGWCVVGRVSRVRVGDVEFGAVPAWVFVRPGEGGRAIRPVRTSSLGVTVTLDAPGGPCFQWSNK